MDVFIGKSIIQSVIFRICLCEVFILYVAMVGFSVEYNAN